MDKSMMLKSIAASLLITVSGTASAAVSYFNDFSGPSDGNWSSYATYTTTESPVNKVLGRFSGATGGSTLSLAGFSVGVTVALEFDLYLFDSWDRHFTNANTVSPYWNPDQVQVSLNGNVIDSFGYESSNFVTQGSTGSLLAPKATGQLGGSSNWNGTVDDRVFHVTMLFSNTSPSLNLTFAALGSQPLYDESFGIDNIRVTTVPGPSSVLLMAAGAMAVYRKKSKPRA